MNDNGTLQHTGGGVCPECGGENIVSTWMADKAYWYVITCRDCDGEEPK